MTKETKTQKPTQTVRLNKNFLAFVKEAKNVENKAELEKLYQKIVGFSFSNIERVMSRAQRDAVATTRAELLIELNMTEDEFNTTVEQIRTVLHPARTVEAQ
jgi:hypothetical protein